MGAIGGLFGTNGGTNGTGVSTLTAQQTVNPTNADQISGAYTGTQNSLAAQNALLSALQGQNGLGNQSQVYGQLQGVANGTGPNPAQAMLNQATGQNVANQAALMAGQRGAAGNVGLLARQAAQQGAATQQAAVGQGAALQANQSLNAINAAGNIANTQAANQIGQTNANTSAQQAEQANLLNAQSAFNQTQAAINTGNTALANTTMQGQQGLLGGALGAAGAGVKALAGANGGDVSNPNQANQSAFNTSGPQSSFGKFLSGVSAQSQSNIDNSNPTTGSQQLQKGTAQLGSGLIAALTSKSPAAAQQAIAGGADASDLAGAATMAAANGGMTGDYRAGGKVNAKDPSQKAVAPGNSYANDKIPAVLSEHEIVIPRSITMGPDPIKNSALFVGKELQKRRGAK